MKGTILIIEDNQENYYLMRYLLINAGYSVHWAEKGAIGIELAGSLKPDCILLDIQLPEMDGYSVAAIISRSSDLNQIPVIAVTSYAMPGDKEKALASGADAYMEKPINPETFVGEVELMMQKHCKLAGGER